MSVIAAAQASDIVVVQKPRVRLSFLDGLRGIAALYVVLHHFSLIAIWLTSSGDWSGWAAHLLKSSIVGSHFVLFQYGHYAVDVFIVLSGYCLMLPVAQSSAANLSSSMFIFFKRRALRILPPYYAALALSLLIFWVLPSLSDVRISYLNWAFPVFQPAAVVTHLFLVHDLFPSYALRINPPMWSVAVEWHIYFLFPLLLLPLWRRFSIVVVTLLALTLGLLPHYAFHSLDQASPWFLGLFALGMSGASICFSAQRKEHKWLDNFHWGTATLFCTLGFVCLNIIQRKVWLDVKWLHLLRFETWGVQWPMDLLVGLATTCFIVYHYKLVLTDIRTSFLLRLLESNASVRLSSFSYSLYLTHSVVLSVIVLFTQRMSMSAPDACAVILGMGILGAVAIAYLFSLAFERPFLPAHYRGLSHTTANIKQKSSDAHRTAK